MTAEARGPFESHSIPDGYRRYLQPVIFEPWAERLIGFAGVAEGQHVLDVASGTGAVARAAARVVGPGGRVIASDISLGMLAGVAQEAGIDGVDSSGAAISTLVSPATELAVPDASFDVVLCQQGFPFIPDRVGAAREMRRVLRPGGTAAVAVWISGQRLEPFDTYADVVRAQQIDAPFTRPHDNEKMSMSAEEVTSALRDGGLENIVVETQELVLEWPSVEAASNGISGTPYWSAIASLDPERQAQLMTALEAAMTGTDGTPVRTVSTAVLGRGTAP